MYKIVIAAYNAGEKILDTLRKNSSHADDIIVVDDCSTDNTFQEVERFNKVYSKNVDVYRLPVNSHKVGAVREGVEQAHNMGADYIITLDDDTVLLNTPEELYAACNKMEKENYAGASFKMKPLKPSNLVEKLQAMEYETHDYVKKYLSGSGTQRCINGAGGIFKIDPLRDLLMKQGQDHDNDDLVVTYELQKNGYKLGYFPELLIETSVPDTLAKKVRQNRRWELGSMKTMGKYKDFMISKAKERNKLSLVNGAEALDHITLGVTRSILDTAVALYSAIAEKNKEKLMLLPAYVPYTVGMYALSKGLAWGDIAKDLIVTSENKLYNYEQNVQNQVWTALNETFPDISGITGLANQITNQITDVSEMITDVSEINNYLADLTKESGFDNSFNR